MTLRLLPPAAFLAAALAAAAVAAAPADDAPPPRPRPDVRLPPNELVPSALEAVAADAAEVADWGHAAVGVPAAWQTAKGAGVLVAVLDTGWCPAHRDLKTQVKLAKDFTGSAAGWADMQGHGTHCAGVIAAAANGVGMVGVAPEAQLLVGKVLGDDGSGSSADIARGIDWAVSQGADVISLSLGGPSPDAATRAAVRRAVAAGVIVVAAAGNDGPADGTVGFPGGYDEAIAVAAVDAKGAVAGFSSRGAAVFVSAPGVNVRSCYPGDRFATMSGTSMATPYVAGVAALYASAAKARGGRPDPAEFKRLLQTTSADIAPPGRDTASGWGLVSAPKVVGAGSVPPPAGPTELRFTRDDFSDDGWAKLLKLNPKINGITIRLDP